MSVRELSKSRTLELADLQVGTVSVRGPLAGLSGLETPADIPADNVRRSLFDMNRLYQTEMLSQLLSQNALDGSKSKRRTLGNACTDNGHSRRLPILRTSRPADSVFPSSSIR